MKMLQRKINEKFKEYAEKNTLERETATSVRNTIVGTLSSVAAIAGGIGSFFVAGPSGVRLFGTALASALGGGSIGAAINAILPSDWVNSESFMGRSLRFFTSTLDNFQQNPRDRAIRNETTPRNGPRNAAAASANSPNTTHNSANNENTSRVWNEVKSTIMSAINSILHYRFRRN